MSRTKLTGTCEGRRWAFRAGTSYLFGDVSGQNRERVAVRHEPLLCPHPAVTAPFVRLEANASASSKRRTARRKGRYLLLPFCNDKMRDITSAGNWVRVGDPLAVVDGK